MLAHWFGTRKSHQPEQPRFFRPTLEVLENRLAPSSMHGMGGPGDNGPGNSDHDHGPPGGPPGHNNVHINAHDSFNTTITDSFNTSVNNITTNQFFTTINNTQIQQTFQTNLLMSAQQNMQATLGLVIDEVQLAADTYFSLIGGMNNPTLATDMHNLQFNIQQNPLEGTATGEVVGFLAFDLALQATVQGQTQGHS